MHKKCSIFFNFREIGVQQKALFVATEEDKRHIKQDEEI